MGQQLKQKDAFNPLSDRNEKNIYWVDKWVSGEGEEAVYESKKIEEKDLIAFQLLI